jgi:hypothetical protein
MTKSAAINSKVKNLKLKKAIIPKGGSAVPTSYKLASPSLSSELHAAIDSAEAFKSCPFSTKIEKQSRNSS